MSPTSKSSSKAKPKPHRKVPARYSPYTIFFRLERHLLLQSSASNHAVPPTFDPSHHDPHDHPHRPAKYRHVKLPPYWYSSAHRAIEEKNRRHRKSAVETMSKEQLTSEISARWKNLDEETLGYVKRLSAVEKKRVKSLLAEMDRDGEREEAKEDKEFIKIKTLQKRAVSKMMDPVKIDTSNSAEAAPASRATSESSSSSSSLVCSVPLKKHRIHLMSEVTAASASFATAAASSVAAAARNTTALPSMHTFNTWHNVARESMMYPALSGYHMPGLTSLHDPYLCSILSTNPSYWTYAPSNALLRLEASARLRREEELLLSSLATSNAALSGKAEEETNSCTTAARTEEDVFAADVLQLIRHGSEPSK
ncbi:hypothetical protein ACHAWO_012648 [Cyclotella atomus]|uniref:HMG box domain-containing protein n=1 Tax=Cyclotella atomus TaxID=382360 RepID=A0ABD3PLS6_9STRA